MPNRILKESICTSDTIDHLNWFEEVLFYRLIVNCDDYGRFDGRAAVIKNRLFPLKDDLTLGTVKSAIQKLVSAGLVITYESMGKPYLYLPTWTVHQSVRAKKSKYPAPAGEVKSSENNCNQMHANAPVIQSNPIRESKSESGSKSKSESNPERKLSERNGPLAELIADDPLLSAELDRYMKARRRVTRLPLLDGTEQWLADELRPLPPEERLRVMKDKNESVLGLIDSARKYGWQLT